MSTSFHWGLDGLQKARFEAYAKLLRLRNGGQAEESPNFLNLPDDDVGSTEVEEDECESMKTNVPSFTEDGRLKRAVLHRLSELVANMKGGQHVSAALMIEWPDRVHILVARNSSFQQKDESNRMLETLRDLAYAATAHENTWNLLLEWYQPRLMYYIVQLKLALKKTNLHDVAAASSDNHTLVACLRELWADLDEATRETSERRLNKVVLLARSIYQTHNQVEFERVVGSNANTRSLRNRLGFLGRLRTCFNTLIRAAQRLSNFSELRIVPVSIHSKRPQGKSSAETWSVTQTFTLLGLALNDNTARTVMGNGKAKWAKGSLLQKFGKLKSPTHETHAEIQLVLAVAQYDRVGAAVFNYIGCSKQSRFLCHKFVRGYGSFTTRGCHGKVYNLVTVPEVSTLSSDAEANWIAAAVASTEKAMMNLLLNKKKGPVAHVGESTVGGSSVITAAPWFENQKLAELAAQHLLSQREAAGDRASDVGANINEDMEELSWPLEIDVNPGNSSAAKKPATIGECEVCERETARRCGYCNLDWFCSEACQQKMSVYHVTKCSARSLTTADIFYRDCLGDVMPKDPQVRDDFGFSQCRTSIEESHLLSKYRRFVLNSDVESSKLDEWRESGVLVEKVFEFFTNIPERSRGQYFQWFARNKHILDPLAPILDSARQDDVMTQALESARTYLDPEDRRRPFQLFTPFSKKYCYLFYAISLVSARPNPNWNDVDLWYDFGYCTCSSDWQENLIGNTYGRLLGGDKGERDYAKSLGIPYEKHIISPRPQPYSFSDFWRAWESRTLLELIDTHAPNQFFRNPVAAVLSTTPENL